MINIYSLLLLYFSTVFFFVWAFELFIDYFDFFVIWRSLLVGQKFLWKIKMCLDVETVSLYIYSSRMSRQCYEIKLTKFTLHTHTPTHTHTHPRLLSITHTIDRLFIQLATETLFIWVQQATARVLKKCQESRPELRTDTLTRSYLPSETVKCCSIFRI